MDYQDFKKLYIEDPVVFHLGMELFDAKGRDGIFTSTDQVLCAAVREKLSALLLESQLMDVVNVAKDFLYDVSSVGGAFPSAVNFQFYAKV